MAHRIITALIVSAIGMSPALAQPADPHAGHHPAGEAKPEAQSTPKDADKSAKDHGHHCPMMKGQMEGKKDGMTHDCMPVKAADHPDGKADHEHP